MIRSVLITFALLCTPLLAQVPMVKTEAITIALDDSDETFFYASAGKVEEFVSSRAGLSEPFVYEGPPRFILHRTKEAFNPPAEGEKPVTPAAYVDLPKGAARILIIAAPKPEGGLRLLAYDISGRSMKNGSYRVFNFSSKDIAIVIGKEKAVVPSTQNRVLAGSNWDDEILDLSCQVGVILDDKKTIKQEYSGGFGHRPIRRHMLFVFDGTRPNEAVRLSLFYDIILPQSSGE